MSKKLILTAIAAVDMNGCIGNNNALPWKLKSDMDRFKEVTMGSVVIMGRKTFESIGRLLPGRQTIIVSRNPDYRVPGAMVISSPEELISQFVGRAFVIGGAEIYNLFMPYVAELDITQVMTTVKGDAFFPAIDTNEWKIVSFTMPYQAALDDHVMFHKRYVRRTEEEKAERKLGEATA